MPIYTAIAEVFFSPHGSATQSLCTGIAHAQRTIHVQSVFLRSLPIARALLAAHLAAIRVEIILDPSDRRCASSQAPNLRAAGVPIFIDRRHHVAHNKLTIIDGVHVWTGSFNYTAAAEHVNAENLIHLTDTNLAGAYLANYTRHREHADPY